MTADDLGRELLTLAVATARETARFLVDERPDGLRAARTKSSPTDVVTAMDTAAERLIAERIRAVRPDDDFLGEEGTATPDNARSAARVRWVVDPIDGTVNYLRTIPAWAVSIAAEVDGAVVAGAVVNPLTDETFAAALGGGATRNGEPIHASATDDLATALVATGFGYDPVRRAEQAAVVGRVIPAVGDIRRIGAASLDLCALACGRVDAYYERGLQPWDVAAGGLIAREAGARVEGWSGGPAGEEIVIGAGQGLFEAFHALLVRASA